MINNGLFGRKRDISSPEEQFDRQASSYETNRLSSWYKGSSELILNVLDLSEDGPILDIGCATGWFLRRVGKSTPQVEGIGIDVSSNMIQRAREKAHRNSTNNLTFIQGDWEKMNPAVLRNKNIKKAICAHTFHYFGNPHSAAKRIFETLTEEGQLVLLERAKEGSFLTRTWDVLHRFFIRDHVRFYTTSGIIGILEHAGFHNVEVVGRIKKFLWKGKFYTNLVLISCRKP